MNIKSKLNNIYIGPKALFDPEYVPPSLLYRKSEEQSLISILNDSISDNFYLTILYQGIQGIGKKVIVNKVLDDLTTKIKEQNNFYKIVIDCNDKSVEELLVSFIIELSKYSNQDCDLNSLLRSNLSSLWNILKLMRKKINQNIILTLNNTETLQSVIYNKIIHFCKEFKITLISTMNNVIYPKTLDIISEFDLKKKLNFFTFNELFDILNQRVKLAFYQEIDDELIQFITDLIFEHYVPVPGKGIDILRNLYPVLKNQKSLNNYELHDISIFQFDTMPLIDEFTMLNYLVEEDILTIIFLDNFSNFFKHKMNFYITFKELRELFDISCESLDYTKHIDEFHEIVKKMINIGILKISKKNYFMHNLNLFSNIKSDDLFFILLNPRDLTTLIDTIFNEQDLFLN